LKAISLFSGGLDSQLAVCLIKDQGIEVIGVNFTSPFFGGDNTTCLAAERLKIKLHTLNIGKEYIDTVLINPVYGYGKHFNPCIDCHAFMLKKAGMFMKENDASFIFSGEVIGQRPMSQNKSALNAVDKLSGFKGLIVRPLSAKLLPISTPESEGWIDRNKLLDITGRGRKRQMELAEKYSIHEYPTPAGGCLLTEPNFSIRLRKLLEVNPKPDPEEMHILKVGRHFYLNNHLLVIGRNHSENLKLQELTLKTDYLFKVLDRPGPLGLLRCMDNPGVDNLQYAASIVARYSDAKNEPSAQVKLFHLDGKTIDTINIKPLTPEKTPKSI